MPPGSKWENNFLFIIALCFGRKGTFMITAYQIKWILTDKKEVENLLLIMHLEDHSKSLPVNILKKY